MFQTRKKILAIIVLLLAATVVLSGCKEKAEPKPSESPSPSPTATTAPSASPSATPKATTAPSASPSAAPKSTTAPDANPASASTATTAPNANPATVTNVETNKQSGTSSNVQQKIESEAEVYNEPETVQTTSGPVGTNQGSTAVPAEEIIIEETVDQAPSSTAAPASSSAPALASTPTPASSSAPAPASTPTPTPTSTPSPTPHVHTPVTDPAIEATCIHSGLSVGSHCSECGAILQAQEVIPKMPHMYLNGACVWCGARDPNAGNGYIIELPIL